MQQQMSRGSKWLYASFESISRTDSNERSTYMQTMELAFRCACSYGHFETAKWLYGISQTDGNDKINIYANSDQAFQWACQDDYLETVRWLCTISSKFNLKYILRHNILDRIHRYIDFSQWTESASSCVSCQNNYVQYRIGLACGHDICRNCFVDNECPLRCNDQNNDLNVSPKSPIVLF